MLKMRSKQEILKQRSEISRKIGYLDYLADIAKISTSKFAKSRQKLIAELHTLDFVLGKTENVDSDEWFEELEEGNSNEK